MAPRIVTEAGFYAGRFLKPGQAYDDDGVAVAGETDNLTKDQLITLAAELGVEVKASATKAEIAAAIAAAANQNHES